jgi:hypothetical protein
MKIGHELSLSRSLSAILTDNGGERRLPFGIKYKLTKISNSLLKDVDMYEKERVKLVQQYGDAITDDKGNQSYNVTDPEKKKAFFTQLNEILATEADTSIQKLTEAELAPIMDLDIDISQIDLAVFFAFIVEGGDPLPEEEGEAEPTV